MKTSSAGALRQHRISWAMRLLVYGGAGLALACFAGILLYILVMGIPHLDWSLFSWNYTSDNVSVIPALINTFVMMLLSLLIAVPAGIGAAIYLCEYAKKGSRTARVISWAADTLNGIPSIVFGLFGAVFFVSFLHLGLFMAAGALSLSLMVLPMILRTSCEALQSVPDGLREGSYGLGAGKLRTIFRIVLPCALPGIVSGVLLAAGRIAGESAVLIFTAGTIPQVCTSLLDSGRTLAVHMYTLSSEGLHIDQTYATAVVLLLVVLLFNAASNAAARWIERRYAHG